LGITAVCLVCVCHEGMNVKRPFVGYAWVAPAMGVLIGENGRLYEDWMLDEE